MTDFSIPPAQIVLGLFNCMDLAIRVFRKQLHDDVFVKHVPEAILTFHHEWVHYLQFLSTPIGRQMSYARRVATINRLTFLAHCPRPISLPLNQWIQKERSTQPTAKSFEELALFEALDSHWGHFWTDWGAAARDPSGPIRDRGRIGEVCREFESQTITVDYLRENQPIALDPKDGAFLFSLGNGREVRFEVSPFNICEFMAFAVEVDVANRRHIRHQAEEHLGIYDLGRLSYTLPLLYLSQHASLEPAQPEPAYSPPLTGLIVACYLSLFMDVEYVQRAGKTSGIPMRELGPYRYPGRFLIRTLELLTSGYDLQSDDDFVQGNWMELFDKLCGLVKWPPFSSIFELAWQRATWDAAVLLDDSIHSGPIPIEEVRFDMSKMIAGAPPEQCVAVPKIESATGKDLVADRLGVVLKEEYQESVKTYNLIWRRPHVIAFPYVLLREQALDYPPVFYTGDDGQPLILWIYPSVAGEDAKRELAKGRVYSQWFLRHLVDKIWHTLDLSCFWPQEVENYIGSLNNCDHSTREECAARRTECARDALRAGRPLGPLDHCISPEWKKIVEQTLSAVRLSLDDIVCEPGHRDSTVL